MLRTSPTPHSYHAPRHFPIGAIPIFAFLVIVVMMLWTNSRADGQKAKPPATAAITPLVPPVAEPPLPLADPVPDMDPVQTQATETMLFEFTPPVPAPFTGQEERVWTDIRGRQIRATLISATPETVTLKTPQGNLHTLPRVVFSAVDDAYINSSDPLQPDPPSEAVSVVE